MRLFSNQRLAWISIGLLSFVSLSATPIPNVPTVGDKQLLTVAADTFNEIAKRAMPAVVSISSIRVGELRAAKRHPRLVLAARHRSIPIQRPCWDSAQESS